MALRELIPWNNGSRNVSARRTEGDNPFLSLHREINRTTTYSAASISAGSPRRGRWGGPASSSTRPTRK